MFDPHLPKFLVYGPVLSWWDEQTQLTKTASLNSLPTG